MSISSAEAFGTATIRTARAEEWLETGLLAAYARLTEALDRSGQDAGGLWPSLYETVTWSITIAEHRGIRHDVRTAVEFVRDGVLHGTLDAIEPHGTPVVWYWRLSNYFEAPTDERHRGRRWKAKREAYDRELAGKRVVDGLGRFVADLLKASIPERPMR